jgi:hypothetical protein
MLPRLALNGDLPDFYFLSSWDLDWLHERIILKQWNEHFLLVMRIRGICFI